MAPPDRTPGSEPACLLPGLAGTTGEYRAHACGLSHALRARYLSHRRPGHHELIAGKAWHNMNMQMEQQIAGGNVVLEHDRSLSAIQRRHGRSQCRGHREYLVTDS